MFLSFICLVAIPEYAITDHGFIDVMQQKIIDPVIEVVKQGGDMEITPGGPGSGA